MYTLNATEVHGVAYVSEGGVLRREAYGFDSYNQCMTGDVTRTLKASSGSAEHLPCVIIKEQECK